MSPAVRRAPSARSPWGRTSWGNATPDSGAIVASGSIGPVKIGRDLKAVTVGGSGAGRIESGGAIASINVGRDLKGGAEANTGVIRAQQNIGAIFGLDLGGTFINSGAIRAAHQLKSLTVGGDIVGNPSHFVAISGRGQLTPSATTDVAIGSAKVTGNVSFANILAGYDQLGVALNPDAQIGTVKVGGNWTSGNVVAGVASGGDTFFGNAGDLSIVSTNDTAIISKIASITIGGTVNGTAVGGDFFGFVAEHVVAVKINGAAIVLTSGPGNNLVPVSTGSATGDFFILEVV